MRATQRVYLPGRVEVVQEGAEGLLARAVRMAAGSRTILPAALVMGLLVGVPAGYGQATQPAPPRERP